MKEERMIGQYIKDSGIVPVIVAGIFLFIILRWLPVWLKKVFPEDIKARSPVFKLVVGTITVLIIILLIFAIIMMIALWVYS